MARTLAPDRTTETTLAPVVPLPWDLTDRDPVELAVRDHPSNATGPRLVSARRGPRVPDDAA